MVTDTQEYQNDAQAPNIADGNSDGSELIPAEVAARQRREGNLPPNAPNPMQSGKPRENSINTTRGYTVDDQGLANNYASTPPVYKAEYPSPEQQRSYVIWGIIAGVFVLSLAGVALFVS